MSIARLLYVKVLDEGGDPEFIARRRMSDGAGSNRALLTNDANDCPDSIGCFNHPTPGHYSAVTLDCNMGLFSIIFLQYWCGSRGLSYRWSEETDREVEESRDSHWNATTVMA